MRPARRCGGRAQAVLVALATPGALSAMFGVTIRGFGGDSGAMPPRCGCTNSPAARCRRRPSDADRAPSCPAPACSRGDSGRITRLRLRIGTEDWYGLGCDSKRPGGAPRAAEGEGSTVRIAQGDVCPAGLRRPEETPGTTEAPWRNPDTWCIARPRQPLAIRRCAAGRSTPIPRQCRLQTS